jgi:hypothetical protein
MLLRLERKIFKNSHLLEFILQQLVLFLGIFVIRAGLACFFPIQEAHTDEAHEQCDRVLPDLPQNLSKYSRAEKAHTAPSPTAARHQHVIADFSACFFVELLDPAEYFSLPLSLLLNKTCVLF